jgi:hypothetical protein
MPKLESINKVLVIGSGPIVLFSIISNMSNTSYAELRIIPYMLNTYILNRWLPEEF